jgi:hypothetical protein
VRAIEGEPKRLGAGVLLIHDGHLDHGVRSHHDHDEANEDGKHENEFEYALAFFIQRDESFPG